MRPDRVVINSPALDQDLCFVQRIKDLSFQQFIPQLAIERFDVAVLPGTAWFNIQRLDLLLTKPAPDTLGNELRPVGIVL